MPVQHNINYELSLKVCNVYEITDQREMLPVEFGVTDEICQIFSVEF
jgi:hypothetical protein